VWISLVVPVAVLLGTLLLQRLEAKLLRSPERGEKPDHAASRPTESLPLLTIGRLERSPERRPAARPALRATS
jgi:hypothetical protein